MTMPKRTGTDDETNAAQAAADAAEREAELERKLGEQMAEVFDDETPDPPSRDSEEEDEDLDVEEDADDGVEEDENAEDAAEAAAEEDDTSDDAPTLPDNYRRALKAYGFSDEEMDEGLATMGGKFIATAEKIYQSRNKQSAEWAELGRRSRKVDPEDEADEAAARTPGGKLERIDPKDFGEEYEGDEFVAKVVEPINKLVDTINTLLPQVQSGAEAAEQAEIQRVAGLVDGFFSSAEMAPYAENYGAGGDALTEAQITARNRVLDTAYDLVTGASLRGVSLNLAEALTMASDMVTAQSKETAAREELVKSLRKRSRGRIQQPGRTRANPRATDRLSPEEKLEAKLDSKLKGLFGGGR
jgi:hypothetical protein